MIEFRISDFIAPKDLIYWRWKLWQSQYYPAAQQQDLQWKLLSGLLEHCFQHVPFYRKKFAELGLVPSDFTSVADLSLVPVLSKETLLDCPDDFKADNFHQFKPRKICTSGTTGTPLTVYWDIGSNVLELTSMWRHFSWSGYRLGQPFLDIRSVLLQEPRGYKWNWKCRGLEMSSDIIDADNIQDYAEIIRHYRVKLWRGHPSSIDALCRLLHDACIDDIKPRYLFTNSEALLENQRDFIESWAGVPVCDSYGLKEHNALICQCPEGGYHIAPEYGVVEIIREDGMPAMPGEEGRIIATSLHNRAFPLLRYDTGDYATRTDRLCSCGRTLPLVDKLTGRIDDRVLDADGKWVSGLHFAFFFVTGVRKAQLVQERPGSLDVYIIPAQDYTPETGNTVRDNLKNKLGKSMEIVIHAVEEVPFLSPGKFKFVINRLGHHDAH
jgi:phenylacetate-CoA ligase